MKICFTMKPEKTAFGGGNQFALNLIDFLEKKGETIVYTLDDDDIDLIFIMDPRILKYNKIDFEKVLDYKLKNKKVKIIHRVNDCDKPRDGNCVIDIPIMRTFLLDDVVVFVSKWTRRYYLKEKQAKTKNNIFINNGCNHQYFYPLTTKKFNKNNIKIVTHHWSNNWNKGFEYYKKLDEYLENNKNISFTFIGRNFPNEYQPKNIKVIGPYFGLELGNVLREHDIYITASKFENCPMHVVEGLSCGLPILYSNDLGGGVEICEKQGGEVYNNFEELLQKLDKIINNYQEYVEKIIYNKLSSDYCNQKYYEVIKSLFA